MKKNHSLILVVFLLAAMLLLLVMFARTMDDTGPGETTGQTQSSTEDSSQATESTPPSDPTEPSESTAPPESSEPTETTEATEATGATEATQPSETTDIGEMIGTLYTRQELEAMDTTVNGYGPGKTSDGKRPPYAQYDQESYGKYGGNFIAPDNGSIYLTFDCGYEYIATDANGSKYRVTEKILDVLKEKNVKAVFFITMDYAKKQPDLVERMIREGHAVGNHSANHPNMPKQTIDKMVSEVMTLHNYVLEHFGYEMNLFRPPEGAFSVQSLAVVQSLGYKNLHWSFAYADYDTEDQPSVSSALQTVTERHHSGAIYLLHAISTTNATILPDVIDFFRSEGYNLELFR